MLSKEFFKLWGKLVLKNTLLASLIAAGMGIAGVLIYLLIVNLPAWGFIIGIGVAICLFVSLFEAIQISELKKR